MYNQESAELLQSVDLNTEQLQETRSGYIGEVKNLSLTITALRNSGKTEEEIARVAWKLRRELGIKYKHLTPPEVLEKIYQLNYAKYGDQLGPTIDYLRNNGKSWEQIIESATRTNVEINRRLGLE